MKRAQALRLLLSLLLAAVAVVWGGLSFQRKVASFQPLGFAAEVPGGFARVLRVEDPATSLRPDDQIFLVDGHDAANVPELARRLKGNETSHLTVLRAGTMVEVLYHRPPLRIDFAYVLLALIGVGYLLIGLFTLVRQGGRQGLLFYLWCLASALLYLLTPVPPVDAPLQAVFACSTSWPTAAAGADAPSLPRFPAARCCGSGGGGRSRSSTCRRRRLLALQLDADALPWPLALRPRRRRPRSSLSTTSKSPTWWCSPWPRWRSSSGACRPARRRRLGAAAPAPVDGLRRGRRLSALLRPLRDVRSSLDLPCRCS